ncbi:HipA domain-containing protein [Comamonas antarctica]|nr:HipA domain-containing protein [Comamonas antarctica]
MAASHLANDAMPRSFLLKSADPGLEDRLFNEAFCQTLAMVMGLRPVAVQLQAFGGRNFLQVERFDVAADAPGVARQLRQGDFRTALAAVPQPTGKRNGELGLAQCFALLRSAACPAMPQLLRFLDYVVFNALIGNDDAHAGSYCLLYPDRNAVLAPLHGTLSTAIDVPGDGRMAMGIGGQYRFSELEAKNWMRFAQETGLGEARVRTQVLEMARTLPVAARRLSLRHDLGFAEMTLVPRIVALAAQRCHIATAGFAA